VSDDGQYDILEHPIAGMTFCANTEIALLAVAYRDGVLAVFERDFRLIEKRGDTKGATLLAGSPNGLILAAANVEGVITLYDFEQLTPLHTLYTSSIEHIRSLVFSGNGHRIIDIRDRQANIWASAVLVSRTKEDSDSLSGLTLAPTVARSD
jgi:WD40 repeat protein